MYLKYFEFLFQFLFILYIFTILLVWYLFCKMVGGTF